MVQEEVTKQLDALRDGLLDAIHRPGYLDYGRYLNYEQTAQYMGVGRSGLKANLARKGIHPVEFNERQKVYDRRQLDELTVNTYLENYKSNLRNGIK